jgi:hypothetical protein
VQEYWMSNCCGCFPHRVYKEVINRKLSFSLPFMFFNKQQNSCLCYKSANWKMIFQNHGEHKVGLYIHHTNVGQITSVSCKDEDVSAQKEVRREDI